MEEFENRCEKLESELQEITEDKLAFQFKLKQKTQELTDLQTKFN